MAPRLSNVRGADLRQKELAQLLAALQDSLVQPSGLMANVKIQQNSMEASLKNLDAQLEDSKKLLSDVCLRLGGLIPPPEDVVRDAESATHIAVDDATPPAPQPPQAPETPEVEDGQDALQTPPAASDNVVKKLMQQQSKGSTQQWQESRGRWPWLQHSCERMVLNPMFEAVISVVIFVNAIIIGAESQLSIGGQEDQAWLPVVEAVFLTIYTFEITARIIAHGWRCFLDPWFNFDFVLVLGGTTALIFALVPTDLPDTVGQVLVLRALRLLRLIRAVRMIQQMRAVWRMVFGLLTSCNTMLSTMALLLLVLYIFAILGIELITNDPDLKTSPTTQRIIDHNFSSLWICFWTLTQFVTMDSLAAIYIPLIKAKPVLSIYFTLVIVVVSISLMNLVTAVLVEAALDHALSEKEEEMILSNAKVREMIPKLEGLFKELDQDNSGDLKREEFEAADKEELFLVPEHILDKAHVGSMTELFSNLDVDESGRLNHAEFIEGCMKIFLQDIPVRDIMMMKMMRLLRYAVKEIQEDIRDLKQR